jgi:hypothetical protein
LFSPERLCCTPRDDLTTPALLLAGLPGVDPVEFAVIAAPVVRLRPSGNLLFPGTLLNEFTPDAKSLSNCTCGGSAFPCSAAFVPGVTAAPLRLTGVFF